MVDASKRVWLDRSLVEHGRRRMVQQNPCGAAHTLLPCMHKKEAHNWHAHAHAREMSLTSEQLLLPLAVTGHKVKRQLRLLPVDQHAQRAGISRPQGMRITCRQIKLTMQIPCCCDADVTASRTGHCSQGCRIVQ